MPRLQLLRLPVLLGLLCCISSATLAKRTAHATDTERYSYILKIQLPTNCCLAESFCAFYKGKPLTFDCDWAMIPEDHKTLVFSIIITPEIRFHAKGNNVSTLERIEKIPFAWYDVTLHPQVTPTATTYTWSIKKLTSEQAPLQIPDHAVTILFNPQMIDTLVDETNNQIASEKNGCHTIALPTIRLHQHLDTDACNDACAQAQLASLDLRTVHQKPSIEVKKEHLAVISICQQ